MTEREQIVAMLTRAGIRFRELTPDTGSPVGAVGGVCIEPDGRWPSHGYSGFVTDWWFDADGQLVGVGTWE